MEPSILHLVTGALGGVTGHVFGWLKARTNAKHEEAMGRIRIDEVTAEAEANVKIAMEATKGAVAKGELAGWRDSYKDAGTALSAGQHLPGWAAAMLAVVDLVRGLMRPVLTLGILSYALWAVPKPDLNPDLVNMLVSLAYVVVPWWFGARTAEKMHGGAASATAGLRAWGVPPDKINEMLAKKK